MDRSSKPLQKLDGLFTLQSLRRSFCFLFILQAAFNIRMYHGGLHAYIEGREAIPSGATSGLNKSSGSGQAAPSLDLGVPLWRPLSLRAAA